MRNAYAALVTFLIFELVVALAYTSTPWNANPVLACSVASTGASGAAHLLVSAFTALPGLLAPLLTRHSGSAAVPSGPPRARHGVRRVGEVLVLVFALVGALALQIAHLAPAAGAVVTQPGAQIGSTDAVYAIFAPSPAATVGALEVCGQRCVADARCHRFMLTTAAHAASQHCSRGAPCCWLEGELAPGASASLKRCSHASVVGMPDRAAGLDWRALSWRAPRILFARLTDVGYTTALAGAVWSGAPWPRRDGGPAALSPNRNPYVHGSAVDHQWSAAFLDTGICGVDGDECGGCATFTPWVDAGYSFDGFKYGPVTLLYYYAASAALYPSEEWGIEWGSGGILLGNAVLLPLLLLAVALLAARLSAGASDRAQRGIYAAALVAWMCPLVPHELLRQGVIDALPLVLGLFALLAAAEKRDFFAGLLAGLSTSAKLFPGAALLLTCAPGLAARTRAAGPGQRRLVPYALGVVCGAAPFVAFVATREGLLGVLSNLVLFPLVRPADATAWHCGVSRAAALKGALLLGALLALGAWARRRSTARRELGAPERVACTIVLCSLLALGAPGNHANYHLPSLALLAALLAATGSSSSSSSDATAPGGDGAYRPRAASPTADLVKELYLKAYAKASERKAHAQ